MRASSRPHRRAEGIVVRHSRRCATREAKRCDCRPGYQAQVFSRRDARTIRKTFRTLADARAWRAEAHSALRRGTLRAPTRVTLADAANEWLQAARDGVIRTRPATRTSPRPCAPTSWRCARSSCQSSVICDERTRVIEIAAGFTLERVRLEVERIRKRGEAYLRTPDRCPPDGTWINAGRFASRDGVEQAERLATPCER